MTATIIPSEELAIRQRLKDDLTHYAAKCLKIRTKAATIEPLSLNQAQRYVHEQIEAQRAATGKVRALILKGRQQGISTYIGGRFYWRATHRRGARVFILTHEQSATDNLFGMAQRFHDHCPELVKPATGASNAKELYFSRLDGGYEVGTAGTKAVGRSKTIQMLHGSEVAFWPNATTHFAGVVQTVPDLPDTEIILESTANGVGGEFHGRWQQAEAGIGDYIAIFVPWFWDEGYRREPGAEFSLDDEEREYAETYRLDAAQMAWRRAKIAELKDPLLFKQEYPATAAEAFQTTGHDSFIPAELVLRARKADLTAMGARILGVDPAHMGDDRFSIAERQGRKIPRVESRTKLDNVAGANWIRAEIDAAVKEGRPYARVFIDVGGPGAGVYDLLKSWGYDKHAGGPFAGQPLCVPVNFGSAPMDAERILPDGTKWPGAKNRRSEMWQRSKDWLNEPGGADIPDRDSLQADACGPAYGYDAQQRLVLESKDHMRQVRKIRSPDEWDAIVLTFAAPVPPAVEKPKAEPRRHHGSNGWMG